MIKKILVLFIVAFLTVTTSFSQKLMHGLGTAISVLYGNIKTPYSSSSFSLAQTNFTYFPRYNFIENENSSVSFGFPVGIGIGIATNTYGGDAGISFAYDLPAVLDYNIGCKSTSENEKNFGGYVGLGLGYYHVSISQSSYSDFKGATYGPMFRGGVRFSSSAESWKGHALTVGMFYKRVLRKINCKLLDLMC